MSPVPVTRLPTGLPGKGADSDGSDGSDVDGEGGQGGGKKRKAATGIFAKPSALKRAEAEREAGEEERLRKAQARGLRGKANEVVPFDYDAAQAGQRGRKRSAEGEDGEGAGGEAGDHRGGGRSSRGRGDRGGRGGKGAKGGRGGRGAGKPKKGPWSPNDGQQDAVALRGGKRRLAPASGNRSHTFV